MAFIITPQANPNAQALVRGAADIKEALRYKKEIALALQRQKFDLERQAVQDQRYEDERAYRQGRDAVMDQRYADEQAQAQATRQADLGLFRGMAGEGAQVAAPIGPTPEGPPMGGGTFQEQQQARRQAFQRLLSDPNLSTSAEKYAREEFQQEEAEATKQEIQRQATEGLVKTRQMVIDTTRQQAIGEEQAAEILPFLDPQKYLKEDGSLDIEAMLDATAKAEAGMTAARKSYARQQTDDQTLAMFDAQFQTALQAATPAFEMGLYSQGELSEGLNEYNMLKLDWPQLDEQQRASRAKALIGKLDFRQRAMEAMEAREKTRKVDPRQRLQDQIRDDLVTRGMEQPRTSQFAEPTYKPMSFDAATEAARLRVNPSTQGMVTPFRPGEQIAPGVNGQVPQQPQAAPAQDGPAARPPGVAPMPGKLRSRTEILGAEKGAAQDPQPMLEAVATAIRLGIPLDQFDDLYGIDLSTLTEDDLRQIEAMVGSAAGKKKP